MEKKTKPYCKRAWLNPDDSSATGSIVAFAGPTFHLDRNGDTFEDMFLEIADCTGKVRLHKSSGEDLGRFIKKLNSLGRVIKDFTDYLMVMETMAEDSPESET